MRCFCRPRPTGTLAVENAPWVEVVFLLVSPRNNEETCESRSLLQLFVAASFGHHHVLLSLRAPTCGSAAIQLGSGPRLSRRFAPRNDTESSPPRSKSTLTETSPVQPCTQVQPALACFTTWVVFNSLHPLDPHIWVPTLH